MRVTSSVIAALAYDGRHNVLEVEFHTGRVYQFFMVPDSAYEMLRSSESIGAYFNRHIRSRYPSREMTR